MRSKMTISSLGAVVAATVTIAAALTATPALAADTSDTPDGIAGLVSEAVAAAAPAPMTSDRGNVTVNIPTDPNDAIELTPSDGPALALTLPKDVDVSAGVTASDGTVVYAGKPGEADVTVQPLESGARVSTVLDSQTADRSFEYALPVGVEAESIDGGRIELTKTVDVEVEGSAATVSAVVGYVEPAWAVDAAGQDVATFYEVVDGAIVQHVETTQATVYPVVADPSWTTTAWNQVRIRWNRAETATIASGGWAATGATAVCSAAGLAIAGPAGAAALGAVCLGLSGAAVYTAGVANNSSPRQCLEMYATYTFIAGPGGWVPWFGTYSGGTCR